MKIALITGAAHGIGLAAARAFLAAGWQVLGLDKDFSTCDERGSGVLFCDPCEATPEERKREVLAVNIEAPNALITALAPQMKARKAGRIVNVGPVAAFTGHSALWYGITKAGILNLTKAWAKEPGPHGVLVNAGSPRGPLPRRCTGSCRSRARTA